MAIFRTVPDVPCKYLRYLPDVFNLKEAIEAVGDDGQKKEKELCFLTKHGKRRDERNALIGAITGPQSVRRRMQQPSQGNTLSIPSTFG